MSWRVKTRGIRAPENEQPDAAPRSGPIGTESVHGFADAGANAAASTGQPLDAASEAVLPSGCGLRGPWLGHQGNVANWQLLRGLYMKIADTDSLASDAMIPVVSNRPHGLGGLIGTEVSGSVWGGESIS